MYNVCLYQFTFGGQLNIHIVILEINFRLVCVCVCRLLLRKVCVISSSVLVNAQTNPETQQTKLIIIFRKYTNIEAFDLLTWALFGLRLNVNRLTSIDLEQEMYTTFI